MTMPTGVAAAVARLTQYNFGVYNASTNPYGLSGIGGMDANWEQVNADIATVAGWLETVGNGSDAAQTAAASSAAAAAASALQAAADRALALGYQSAAEAAAATALTAAHPLEPAEIAAVPPLLDLLLTDAMALPAGAFARASAGSAFDAGGLLRGAATNAPRIGHAPSTGRRRGLLIEPAATNILVRSAEFDSAYWPKSDVSVTANAAVAPDGTAAMDKLVETATTGLHRLSQPVALVSGQAYCFSCYAKAGERGVLKLEESGGGWSTAPRVTFNLATGTVQNVNGSPTSYGIEPVGGGVYRFWVTATATATSGLVLLMLGNSASGEAIGYTGDGTSGLYLWGAQLEAADRPSSPIVTAGSTVTRAADLAILSDLSWLPAEYTLLVEAETEADGGVLLWLSDGSYNNRLHIARGAGGFAAAYVVTGGTTQAALASAGALWPAATRTRLALAGRTNDVAFAAGGTLVGTDAAVTLPAVTSLRLGADHTGATALPGWVSRLTVFPRRLSDATLQLLTQG